MPVIKVDDVEYEVEAGQNMIEAAASIGIDIPHYCYHPGLSVSGNCRMCLIEVKGPRGTTAQIACNTMVSEGLDVGIENDNVKKMRQGVMEFLLLNHPIDCPICDQAGECGLQDYYMDHGLYTNRSTVPKVKKSKVVDVGPLVMLDQERCILCSRCVRFCDEVTETHELVITQRGEQSRIETFPGEILDNPYSGNVIDLCPVGALTSKDFRFKKRVWFLSTANSICTGCSRGCNVYMDYEKENVYRYRPRYNPDVNQWWMCDEGRLSYKALHTQRLDAALVKNEHCVLERAVEQASLLIQDVLEQSGKQSVLVIGSPRASLEDNFILKHMLLQATGSEQIFAPNLNRWGEADDLLRLADKTPNLAGVKLLGIETEREALQAAFKQGPLKLVIAMEQDDPELLGWIQQSGAELIVLASHESALTQAAAIALPITSHAEHYASYVNANQQLQKVNQAFYPTSGARPAWRLIAEIFKPLLTAAPKYGDVEDVWTVLRTKVESLAKLTFYEIPDQGLSLAPPPAPVSEDQAVTQAHE